MTPEDICDQFDCEYHRFIQGAIVHNGCIYSTEGFENDEINRPAIRVIDLATKSEKMYVNLLETEYKKEPEMIDFYADECYYSDYRGNLYNLELSK